MQVSDRLIGILLCALTWTGCCSNPVRHTTFELSSSSPEGRLAQTTDVSVFGDREGRSWADKTLSVPRGGGLHAGVFATVHIQFAYVSLSVTPLLFFPGFAEAGVSVILE